MSNANSNALEKVETTKPVAPYLGGKSRLAKLIVERINAIDHHTYCEPFVGMGGVFLRRNKRPRAEVINDYSREVYNLFRTIQEHYAYFIDYMKFRLCSRSEFERLIDTNPDTLTDIQKAARFLYLQKTAFGGKISGKNFGVSVDRPARFDITKLVPMLDDVHTRLSSVTIECLSFEKFIPRYDRPGTLFYLDPPYFGCENDYGKDMFSRSDFEKLAELLANIKGRFILSLNDTPEVREIFKAFDIEVVQTKYSVGQKASSRGAVNEVLITN